MDMNKYLVIRVEGDNDEPGKTVLSPLPLQDFLEQLKRDEINSIRKREGLEPIQDWSTWTEEDDDEMFMGMFHFYREDDCHQVNFSEDVGYDVYVLK